MSGDYQVTSQEGAGGLAGHLFIEPEFLRFQAREQDKALVTFLAAEPGREPVASLTFGGTGARWSSPITGAFGGVAATERARAAAVFALVDAAMAWLRRDGLKAVVRLPPGGFDDPAAGAFENAMFRSGWRLRHVDLNYHLNVVAPDAFLAGLGETKQKEVRRLLRSGAVFRTVRAAEGAAAYEVIAENRAGRGFPMTMAWPQVSALAGAFPDRVTFHAVERDGAILAAAICLTITPTWRYVFYWGEAPEFRREGPVVLLAHGLIADSHAAGMSILDLGTSTENSQPNPGLISFKEGLRSRATAKRVYEFPG